MELDRVALDLGHEQVVLELLDPEIEQEGGDEALRSRGQADEDRRDRGDDRADERDELQEAGDEREQDGVAAEDRVDDDSPGPQADERGKTDGRAQDQLAADPLARTRGRRARRSRRRLPATWAAATLEASGKRRPVLEQEEQPGGQDEVAEDRRHERGGAVDERAQEADVQVVGRVQPRGDERIGERAQLLRQSELVVQLVEVIELVLDRPDDVGQLGR